MAYFEWWDDMEIDQGPIDADHRKLIEQVNVLHSATSAGKGHEVVASLLTELINDTVAHIRREEQYLTAIGYPELPGHHQGHENFINDLRGLQKKYETGSITVASQLSTVLRDWLSIHIRRNDKAVVPFLREQKRLQPLAKKTSKAA